MNILLGILGAILNRSRGGGLYDLLNKYNIIALKDLSDIKTLSKISHDIIFAVVFCFYYKYYMQYSIITSIIILYLAMLAGRSFGWGSYIEGMISERRQPPENILIDNIIKHLKVRNKIKYLIALSLRGVIWTFFISVGFFLATNITYFCWIIPIGSLMGSCYLLAIELCDVLAKRVSFINGRGNGWQWGEVFWGFVLWSLISILIYFI